MYTCNVCWLFGSHLHIKSIQFWRFEFNKRDGMRDASLGGNGKTRGKLADFLMFSIRKSSEPSTVASYMTVKFYCYAIFFCFFASLGFRIAFNGSKQAICGMHVTTTLAGGSWIWLEIFVNELNHLGHRTSEFSPEFKWQRSFFDFSGYSGTNACKKKEMSLVRARN